MQAPAGRSRAAPGEGRAGREGERQRGGPVRVCESRRRRDADRAGRGTLTGSQSDSRTGVGDLYPSASLRRNRGVHNFMPTRRRSSRWVPTTQRDWPTSAPITGRLTRAAATRTSTPRAAASCRQRSGSRTTSRIPTPTTRTGSAATRRVARVKVLPLPPVSRPRQGLRSRCAIRVDWPRGARLRQSQARRGGPLPVPCGPIGGDFSSRERF